MSRPQRGDRHAEPGMPRSAINQQTLGASPHIADVAADGYPPES